MSRRLVLVAVVAALLIAAAGGGYLVRGHLGRPDPSATATAPPAANGVALAEALQMGFVDVAQQVRPAVVHLGTIQRAKTRRGPNLPQGNDDPFFRDFFNQFFGSEGPDSRDRKSTRLNSSHPSISYAVFCLKKKKHTIRSSTSTTIGASCLFA